MDNKKKTQLTSTQVRMAGIIFGILIILTVIVAISSPKPSSSASQKSTTTSAKATESTKTTEPATNKAQTSNIASLNAQVVPMLTNETDAQEQVYNNVATAASKPDASTYTSDFHQLWDYIEHTTKYYTIYPKYSQAGEIYTKAKQPQPSGVDDWDGDLEQVYSDLVTYTDDQFLLLSAQATNNPTDTARSKVDAASATYESDLAKARADIKQLDWWADD